VVVLLHALWDGSQGIALWLTLWFTDTPTQRLISGVGGVPNLTQAQVHTYTILSWTLLALDGLVGVLILRGRWRRATATLDSQTA
jgi:protease PrsW